MPYLVAVMLLGGLRRSVLEIASGVLPACLPLDATTSLLGAWFDRVAETQCSSLRIVASADSSDRPLGALIDAEIERWRGRHHRHGNGTLLIERVVESSTHRGTGGLLRDIALELTDATDVLFLEPHCVPPQSLRPLVDAGSAFDCRESRGLLVGITGSGEGAPRRFGRDAPAGACLIERDLLQFAPKIGYHDFKEQFIPLLVERGIPIRPVPLDAGGMRVHDLPAYRAAVSGWLAGRGPSVASGAEVARTTRLIGATIVAEGARIGEDAIVQDSVILNRAAIGEGAVVARSVVPAGFRVAPRSLVVDRILDAETSAGADELLALGRSSASESVSRRART